MSGTEASPSNHGNSEPRDQDASDRGVDSEQLERYRAWLTVLARMELDARFQQKYSASDVVQQTMLEAWRDWSQATDAGEAGRRAWLRGILAHQIARFARHYAGTAKRDPRRERSIDQTLAESAMRLDQMLAADQSTPSQQAQTRERSLQLARILEELPPDYREVITLRNLQELSFDEVANRMERSAGAVRMLWVRALAALREAMPNE